MINLSEAILNKVIIHKIGNRKRDEVLNLSDYPLKLNDAINAVLKAYFLSPFKLDSYYSFTHETDLQQNEVFNYAKQLFNDNDKFLELSKRIAEHLYNKTSHSKIKTGELYIAYMQNCMIEDEVCDAIGIFKSETKQNFLKIYEQTSNIDVSAEEGVNIKKLDKACLILNIEQEQGYKLCIIDNVNKQLEAQYWREEFLNIKQREDSYYQTQNLINICKGFVEEVYNESNEIERPDQIDMLNKSAQYFTEKEDFDVQEFKEEVLQQDEVKDAFEQYKDFYQEKNEVALNDNFKISQGAVKRGKAQFKSVLKLDKNFHIYIHGDRTRIIKGFDNSNGMHYYQVYYENEE